MVPWTSNQMPQGSVAGSEVSTPSPNAWSNPSKTECLGRMIFLGEDSLRYAVTEYIEHHHHERTHQGKDNRLLFPLRPSDRKPRDGPVQCRERLGGLLKFYYKEAA